MLSILSTRLIKSCINIELVTQCRHLYATTTKIDENLAKHNNYYAIRWKSKKSKQNQQDSQTEEESDNFDDEIVTKGTKVITVRVHSLRIDAILKAGLNIARNKIETLFYESKIRVNGEKVLKKSSQANEGDEIDVVRGVSPTNPNFLIVGRVELIKATADEENILVKMRRTKSLTIENYNDGWKPN